MLNEFLILLKPELSVTILIFILLIVKVFGNQESPPILNWINLLLFINLVIGLLPAAEGMLFNDMFRTSRLIQLEKSILNLGTLIVSMQAYPWLKHHKHAPEFYMLLLSTLLGMFFMISGGNLLMFYLGLELSTIPLAALANFNLSKRLSSEAAMKYIMSAAFSSGLLLFGISLMYGTTGSVSFHIITQQLNASPLQLFAFILLFSGFAFKVSVVPFHLWTADVYQGAPVAITSYLSVVSKGAVFFVFVSVLYTVFGQLAGSWYNMLLLLSVLTMLIGNLFAIRQNNLKRFLAFSSIAQAGFVLIGMSASSPQGSASVVYFILVYLFSNLGAFGVVAVISEAGKENLEDYKGLYASNPVLAWAMAISLFSLAGIPPTAGFFGKFFLLMAGAGKGNYLLITIAALNMVIALYYYLVVVKAMFVDTNKDPLKKIELSFFPKLAMLVCGAGIVLTGLAGWIYDYIFSLTS